ncbi:MAG: ABC transporter permease [Rhodospirillaceae bacterium]|nr:ABC transporter permease [Rhodospirillaceae bacterium]
MWRRISIVLNKEVIDNARDRRSLLMALIYPLMGPLLLALMIYAIDKVVVTGGADNSLTLHIQGAEHAPELINWLSAHGHTVIPAPADAEAAVRDGDIEVAIVIPATFEDMFVAETTAPISVLVNTSRLTGLITINRVGSILSSFNTEIWGQRIARKGVAFRSLQPLDVNHVNVSSGTHIADILLIMVPPLFIFNLFMGGTYLAIDTTSGERERGSLEPLLINPIERWELVGGKFLAALFYTAIAVLVQLLALKGAFSLGGGENLSFNRTLSWQAIFNIMVLTLPLMMAAVSVQFIIATMTRSFKEAQTYLGLLPLVPAIPGMLLVYAPVKAEAWMMSIPTFSQTLLLGEVLRGDPLPMLHVALSMATTLALAMVLLFIATRLYEREELIFGS